MHTFPLRDAQMHQSLQATRREALACNRAIACLFGTIFCIALCAGAYNLGAIRHTLQKEQTSLIALQPRNQNKIANAINNVLDAAQLLDVNNIPWVIKLLSTSANCSENAEVKKIIAAHAQMITAINGLTTALTNAREATDYVIMEWCTTLAAARNNTGLDRCASCTFAGTTTPYQNCQPRTLDPWINPSIAMLRDKYMAHCG